MDRDGVFGRR
jgi:serine/threonine protein kinase